MIEAGKFYRRKDDGQKLMALQGAKEFRMFWVAGTGLIEWLRPDEVEPWHELMRGIGIAWMHLFNDGSVCSFADKSGACSVIGRRKVTVEVIEGEFDE